MTIVLREQTKNPVGNHAQPLPSLQGEGSGVGSVIYSYMTSYSPHPLPLPYKGGERLTPKCNRGGRTEPV